MNKPLTKLLLTVACVSLAGIASAQSGASAPAQKTIQVAAINPEKPVMSYEVASLMQMLQKAQAQHRRTGQAQDLARVEAVRRELASRGFGRATQLAPVMLANTTKPAQADRSVRVSVAD